MKALGITAMVLAIVAIFVPILGPPLTVVVALLAAFAAGRGLTFGVVAILVNIVNVVFLSPSLWLGVGIAESESAGNGQVALLGMGVVLIGSQLAAAAVLTVTHIVWRRNQVVPA